MQIEVTWLLEEESETEMAPDQLIIIQGKKEKKKWGNWSEQKER